MNATCQVLELGEIDYPTARGLQSTLAAERAAGVRTDCLLLLMHPHTYTLGSAASREHLLLSERQLHSRGIAVYTSDRGGDITYHGPGQLVGYPLLALGRPQGGNRYIPRADYVGYVRNLEVMLINVLARFGIPSGQLPGMTGVWVEPDVASRCSHCPPEARQAPTKIAAIGVRVDRNGISQHGFALNVDTQTELFEGIVPCGLRGYGTVSMSMLLSEVPSMQSVRAAIVREFGRIFRREMVIARLPEGECSRQRNSQ
ncbi:MAG: lipoyl(octanoyl) transferase LipB [Anaerolineales bacterium]|nr:lipoyl(octanoyl) transferase LipB [Anaerolineales bacterium]